MHIHHLGRSTLVLGRSVYCTLSLVKIRPVGLHIMNRSSLKKLLTNIYELSIISGKSLDCILRSKLGRIGSTIPLVASKITSTPS